ncbi:adhesion G-protein coupled receptor G1 isoform X9 [Dicentrarchus labrax]|uniref:G-protein coupled receptor 97 n=1 Tax=Dicentrarchus labrax TaxID=13489 RepID=A0A8C4ECU9_DICLA|nr:adhesion G-protein coupled receptor G1 isoform X1 [Dicentrarchus labrax]XP_051236088.1 adhesion G-protein coupled receptor G1 isoform X2 [Dicentrarchus labrax]XP_051236089.1 adhesion G-protein coupled receptor G1 isoform X3 [Dicentrarchus labrax]XP_051236090.1 adhesion G-protein coupled receptor G1 isoform X4 [Dicentrarchus labrax]XP_051236091.1 adhesion G-protein coupled receptor G1 isoform X5 [Dicentrarchus labrax]XP_051236092.1 adhesion G-protein coupled receptor G1 isoform X6 [Dicentrar
MWITLFFLTLVWFAETQAGGRGSSNQGKSRGTAGPLLTVVRDSYPTSSATLKPTVSHNNCEFVLDECLKGDVPWTRCYEDRIGSCVQKGRFTPGFVRLRVNSSQEAEASPTFNHRIHIPSSALRKSRGTASNEEVLLVAAVINSTHFKLSPPRKRRMFIPAQPIHMQGTVMGDLVLAVRAGNYAVRNLSQPIKLTFTHNKQAVVGTCVFWQESEQEDGTGHWSTEGCDTNDNGMEFVCSCNHMSFFAVLVNPVLTVDETNAVTLSYITYIGSALSVIFTVISLIIYICLQRRRPEKAIGVHMHLTGALLCLHLSFLLSCFWVRLVNETEEGWVCRGLGLFLHWSMLATFSWMALEGFHLYLLLVRVFNIYVRRYLLKLSLVGWGFPTLTVLVCGIVSVYGKYSLEVSDNNNQNSTAQICWMSSQFPQRLLVSYITTVALPCLVILYNSCMLGLVVFKLWELRRDRGGTESSSGWKKVNKEKRSRLWKDCATVLGLSCVLGLPWGLASTTYISLPGIYAFTIINSLQGVFLFLWSLALTCKSRPDSNSSVRDTSSTQKMMTTSFNN